MSSTADVVAALTGRFHADRAVGLSAVFQFVVTGDDGGTWHAAIANGACTVSAGDHASPGVTISPEQSTTWRALALGMLSSTRTIRPWAIPISFVACRPWLGSITVPPTSSRSNGGVVASVNASVNIVGHL